jgi:hypothetical protein
MSQTHEVISAFLDGEAFDPAALGEALADPDGRTMLIDLLALRHLVAASPDVSAVVRPRRAPRRTLAVAAAALVLATFLGYSLGGRRAAAADVAPTPTRIVQPTTGWQ